MWINLDGVEFFISSYKQLLWDVASKISWIFKIETKLNSHGCKPIHYLFLNFETRDLRHDKNFLYTLVFLLLFIYGSFIALDYFKKQAFRS